MAEPESLAGAEPLSDHIERHRTDRIIMLSDGIFAIVTTLAALEIHMPSGMPTFAAILNESGQSLIAYGLSFLFTAVFWHSNRELFARVARTDLILTALTLAMLCAIAVVPAAVKAFYVPGGIRSGFKFYAAVMTVCGLTNASAWLYWALRPGISRTGISRIERLSRAVPTAFMPVLFALMVVSDTANLPWTIIVLAGAMVLVRRVVLPRYLRRTVSN